MNNSLAQLYRRAKVNGLCCFFMFLLVSLVPTAGYSQEAPSDQLEALQQRKQYADSLRQLGQFQAATTVLDSILPAATDLKAWTFAVEIYVGLASMYLEAGQAEWAFQQYILPAKQIVTAHPNPGYGFSPYFLQILEAQCLFLSGRYSLTKKAVAQADSIIGVIESQSEAQQIGSSSLVVRFVGEQQKSFLALAMKDSVGFMTTTSRLFALLDRLSAHPQQPILTATTYTNLGLMYEALGLTDSARWAQQQALALLPKDQHDYRANCYYNLAESYANAGEFAQATLYNQLSMNEVVTAYGANSPDLSESYLLAAQIALDAGRPDSALHFLQKVFSIHSIPQDSLNVAESVPRLADVEPNSNVFTALLLLSEVHQEMALLKDGDAHHLSLAVENGHLAQTLMDSIRKAGYLGKEAALFSPSTTIAEQMGIATNAAFHLSQLAPNQEVQYFEQALRFSETTKYNQLLYGITRGEIHAIDDLDPDSLDRERLLHSQLAYYTTALFAQRRAPGSDSLTLDLQRNRNLTAERLRRLIAYFQREHPRYYQLRYTSSAPTLAEIQNSLAGDEAILEFFVSQEHIFRFLITADHRTLDIIEWTDSLRTAVGNFRSEVSKSRSETPDYSGMASAGHTLYRECIAPAIEKLCRWHDQHWHLSIISDGALRDLSWAATLTEMPRPTNMTNPAAWPYLVFEEQITLNYQHAISISLTDFNRSKVDYQHDYAALAAWYPVADLSAGRATAERLAGQKNWRAQARLGSASAPLTMNDYWNLAGTAKIFHLSMHAQVDGNDPMATRLMLAPGVYITVGDLYQQDLTAHLVIIDACQSHLGQEQIGEGVLSLATGYAYVGVPATIASLWRVEEKSSGYIMEQFIAYLQSGARIDVAWQQAQIDYLNSEDGDKSPFYWATMIPIGQMDPVYPSDSYLWWYFALAGLILLLLVGWVIRSRSQKN